MNKKTKNIMSYSTTEGINICYFYIIFNLLLLPFSPVRNGGGGVGEGGREGA